MTILSTLGPVWYVLYPLAALGALIARERQMRRAHRTGLIRPWALRRLRWALALCGSFLLLTFLSVFYDTTFWLPILAALSACGIAATVRTSWAGVHPGLCGLRRPMPSDGVELVERERTWPNRRASLRWWSWRLAPVLPMLPPLLLAAGLDLRRWPVWLALGGSAFAPLLLTATRRAWVRPLVLLGVSATLGWHALGVGAQLPPGRWSTPWSAARCSAGVALAGDGTAWCVDRSTGTAYHYQLRSGVVLGQHQVKNGWQVFAANTRGAWIKRFASNELVYFSADERKSVQLFFPLNGALTDTNHLWFVDATGRLHLYSEEDPLTFFPSRELRLYSTLIRVDVLPDQTVWVGALSGASRRHAITGTWHGYGESVGIHGPVFDFAFAPDGTIWLLHRAALNSFEWWLSALRPNGVWQHTNLAHLTGLAASRSRDAIAVDGLGRVWFAAVSPTYPREKVIGVLNPDGTLAHRLYTLNGFAGSRLGRATGFVPRLHAHGVLPDGNGGIYLYNGEHEPLRHWRP